jgi:hypothetical protein
MDKIMFRQQNDFEKSDDFSNHYSQVRLQERGEWFDTTSLRFFNFKGNFPYILSFSVLKFNCGQWID